MRFELYSWVEKFTGDYRCVGQVRAVYTTSHEKLRYVVEIHPQGFQHIFTAEQLRPAKEPEA